MVSAHMSIANTVNRRDVTLQQLTETAPNLIIISLRVQIEEEQEFQASG